MGLLDRFFSNPETLAQELVADDTKATRLWTDYLESTQQKGKLLASLKPGDLAAFKQLYALINTEFAEITDEFKTDEEIISDLAKIEHAHNLRKTERLDACFHYATSKLQFAENLLNQLLQTLSYELKIARQLSRSSAHDEEFIARLKEFWTVEQSLLKQISGVKNFQGFFLQLVKGEKIIQRLTKQEKRMISMLERSLANPNPTLIGSWGMAVKEGLIAKLEDLMAEGVVEYHPSADFEFVNRPEFIKFVTEIIVKLRGKEKILPQTVNSFVHVFREWYNARENA